DDEHDDGNGDSIRQNTPNGNIFFPDGKHSPYGENQKGTEDKNPSAGADQLTGKSDPERSGPGISFHPIQFPGQFMQYAVAAFPGIKEIDIVGKQQDG